MALPSSPDAPQPLRVIVGAVKDWVERLGPVWVEGQLIEDDGKVLGPGDLVFYRDGTEHHSYTPNGCLLAVHLAGPEISTR